MWTALHRRFCTSQLPSAVGDRKSRRAFVITIGMGLPSRLVLKYGFDQNSVSNVAQTLDLTYNATFSFEESWDNAFDPDAGELFNLAAGTQQILAELAAMERAGEPAEVVVCASRGGVYMRELWQQLEAAPGRIIHGWRGASVMINVARCKGASLPKGVPVVLLQGGNDQLPGFWGMCTGKCAGKGFPCTCDMELNAIIESCSTAAEARRVAEKASVFLPLETESAKGKLSAALAKLAISKTQQSALIAKKVHHIERAATQSLIEAAEDEVAAVLREHGQRAASRSALEALVRAASLPAASTKAAAASSAALYFSCRGARGSSRDSWTSASGAKVAGGDGHNMDVEEYFGGAPPRDKVTGEYIFPPGWPFARVWPLPNQRVTAGTLLQAELLPRAVDAALAGWPSEDLEGGQTERRFHASWRESLLHPNRLEAEEMLGLHPQQVVDLRWTKDLTGISKYVRGRVVVERDSEEFSMVESVFVNGPADGVPRFFPPPAFSSPFGAEWSERAHVVKVERVQNGDHEQAMLEFYGRLERNLQGQGLEFDGGVDTRWLFHCTGTGADGVATLDNIVRGGGFDPDYTKRMLWGGKVYFARDASYCDWLGAAPSAVPAVVSTGCGKVKQMLLCLVATGTVCLGSKDLILGDQARDAEQMFRSHCAVDDLSNPEIFAVSRGEQALAGYIIHYQVGDTKRAVPARRQLPAPPPAATSDDAPPVAVPPPVPAPAPPPVAPNAPTPLDVAKQTMDPTDRAIEARDALRQAIQLRDYDKIEAALDNASKAELNVQEMADARALLMQLEAEPLPADYVWWTMAQLVEFSRSRRWRFEKFGGLRPRERFTKGRLMLTSTKKKMEEGMLTYMKDVIPRSLLDIESSLAKQAVQCHKCLLGFCGDRKTTFPAALGRHILMTGVQSVELRDEIFIQICKHLTGNPDVLSMTCGWILMCLCVDAFPPSVEFTLYLFNFLGTAAEDETFREYARYALARCEEFINLSEDAIKKMTLERGLPSVEFVGRAVARHVLMQKANPYRVSQIIPHSRPWQQWAATSDDAHPAAVPSPVPAPAPPPVANAPTTPLDVAKQTMDRPSTT